MYVESILIILLINNPGLAGFGKNKTNVKSFIVNINNFTLIGTMISVDWNEGGDSNGISKN